MQACKYARWPNFAPFLAELVVASYMFCLWNIIIVIIMNRVKNNEAFIATLMQLRSLIPTSFWRPAVAGACIIYIYYSKQFFYGIVC